MTPEHAHGLFQYNQWANRRVLDACALLTSDQLLREMGSSFPSVRDTLAHLYGAEWIWHERLLGRSHAALTPAAEFPDVATLRAKLEHLDSLLVDYTLKLTSEDLARVLSYKNLAGKDNSNPLWQIFQHLANHGTYHRGQVTTMLRQLGAKPTSTDMIGFFREQSISAKV